MNARYPADGNGGTCKNILDFSNGADEPHPERGGYDPEAPQHVAQLRAAGRVIIGHTWNMSDPRAPVFCDPGDIYQPGELIAADLRCRGCVTKVSTGPAGPDTMIVIEHEAGCPDLGRMLSAVTS